MTKELIALKRLSEMYDIYLAFRRAKVEADIPVDSPIPGMSVEEFEALRRKALAQNYANPLDSTASTGRPQTS